MSKPLQWCGACKLPHGPDRRPGTADSDINILAGPYCAACGYNQWGVPGPDAPAYLVSQQRLEEAVAEADAIKWETAELRDGKWVWAHD